MCDWAHEVVHLKLTWPCEPVTTNISKDVNVTNNSQTVHGNPVTWANTRKWQSATQPGVRITENIRSRYPSECTWILDSLHCLNLIERESTPFVEMDFGRRLCPWAELWGMGTRQTLPVKQLLVNQAMCRASLAILEWDQKSLSSGPSLLVERPLAAGSEGGAGPQKGLPVAEPTVGAGPRPDSRSRLQWGRLLEPLGLVGRFLEEGMVALQFLLWRIPWT